MATQQKQGLSWKEAAKLFGVTKQTLTDWKVKQWLVQFPDRSINENATRINVEANRHPTLGGKSDRGTEPKPSLVAPEPAPARAPAPLKQSNMTMSEAIRRKATAQALKAELELAQAERELIPRGAAEKVYCDVVAKVRANIEALPSRLADSLVGLDAAHIKAAIEREVCSVLSAISEAPPNV